MNDKNYTGGWDYWFEPQASTDWGKWGPVKLCPSNGFAIGFDLKVGAMIKIRDVDLYIYIYMRVNSINDCINCLRSKTQRDLIATIPL